METAADVARREERRFLSCENTTESERAGFWTRWIRRIRAFRAAHVQSAEEHVRLEVARTYLRGQGVEIGALHRPLAVPRGVKVSYVDRAPVPELRRQYPEFNGLPLAPVHIIADGQTLEGIADTSQDFVIANHVIEHMEDPILALKNWLRVLRPGGVIYLVLPDKRFTFDAPREVTSIEHVMRDHREGPQVSRRDHYREWAEKVARVKPERVQIRAEEMDKRGESIHYHVWGTPAFTRFLLHIRAELKLPFEIELLRRNGHETVFILSRSEPPPPQKQN